MRILVPAAAVVVLFVAALLAAGSEGGRWIVGVLVPYAAALVFLAGLVLRVLGWARSPVPFRIPTTCGQQKSLDWIRQSRVENPSSTAGVVARMALEVRRFVGDESHGRLGDLQFRRHRIWRVDRVGRL